MKCESSGVAPLKKAGITYSEPTDQVEILNEQFVSVFPKEDITSMPTVGIPQHLGKWSEETASWSESITS